MVMINQQVNQQVELIVLKMGPCISHKNAKLASESPLEYGEQKQNQKGVIHPLFTTLFNMLRKPDEIQIIRQSGNKEKLFKREAYPNITALTDKDIKMLYSFKNILFVGDSSFDDMLIKIKSVSNPKSVYAISQLEAKQFLGRFPIFGPSQPTINSKFLPIFAINSDQFLKKGKKRQVFIHQAQNEKKQIYKKLDIRHVIADKTGLTGEQLTENLKNHYSPTTSYTYPKQKKSEDLLNVLSTFLVMQYGLMPFNAQVYIRRCLPQISLNSQIPTIRQISTGNTMRSIKQAKQQLSLTQLYQKYLLQLYDEMSSKDKAAGKIERSYNLLGTLISNIYNNKGNDSYRKVRKTNKQIDDLLGKYKNGVALLNQVGFVDSGGQFVNSTDAKYLKIFKTDLDMAYRNFFNSIHSS